MHINISQPDSIFMINVATTNVSGGAAVTDNSGTVVLARL